jgi:hypothetical protein
MRTYKAVVRWNEIRLSPVSVKRVAFNSPEFETEDLARQWAENLISDKEAEMKQARQAGIVLAFSIPEFEFDIIKN